MTTKSFSFSKTFLKCFSTSFGAQYKIKLAGQEPPSCKLNFQGCPTPILQHSISEAVMRFSCSRCSILHPFFPDECAFASSTLTAPHRIHLYCPKSFLTPFLFHTDPQFPEAENSLRPPISHSIPPRTDSVASRKSEREWNFALSTVKQDAKREDRWRRGREGAKRNLSHHRSFVRKEQVTLPR